MDKSGELLVEVETIYRKELLQLEELYKEKLALMRSVSNTQVEKIKEQEQLIAAYRKRFLLERIKTLLRPRLGKLDHYESRFLYIPKHYAIKKSLQSPPKISIVTPSFKQGEFIDRTITSVLSQEYPNLEYIVQDGGSEDETVKILKGYGAALTHWESVPDKGQSHAINMGFRHATGNIMAYLNSDDLLLPGALHYVADYFEQHPDVDVVYGHRVVIDEDDNEIGRWVLPPHDDQVLLWADYVPQETLFWRRSIWEKAGGAIDENFQFAMDWDLILRFREAGAKFVRLPRFLGAFRIHHHQKSSATIHEVGVREMRELRIRSHGRIVTKQEINQQSRAYLLRHVLCYLLYRLKVLRY